MPKTVTRPEIEPKQTNPSLPEVANDNDGEFHKVQEVVPGAANDNDTVINFIPQSTPEASNDNLEHVDLREKAQIAEVLERLQEHKTAEVVIHPETISESSRTGATESSSARAQVEAASAAGSVTPSGTGSGKRGSSVTSKEQLISTRKPGGKLWGFLKGFAKFAGFLVGGTFALAMRGLHAATGKIMAAAGAQVNKK